MNALRLAVLLLGLTGLAQAGAAETFTNPVFRSQDPWITRVGGVYYYIESGCGVADICVKRSRSLTGLASAPWIGVWTHHADTDSNGRDIWAPELHFIDGRWFIYYAADDGDNNHHRLFALVSSGTDGQLGTFREADTGLPHGQLVESSGHWAIDPNVFMAADGKRYLTWSCTNQADSTFPQRICLARMRDPLTLGRTAFISTPARAWETRGAAIQEGPVGYTRHGRTYITYSGSASWVANDYAVGLLSLRPGADPLQASSWRKRGPIFDRHGRVYGPGSVVFVPSPDDRQYWNLYHGIDRLDCTPAYDCRDIRMQQMFFDAHGAPMLGYPVDPGVALARPSGEGGDGPRRLQARPFGPAWGDAAEGHPQAGQVVGAWSYPKGLSALSALGGAWDQAFRRSNPNAPDLHTHVEVAMQAKGTTQAFPKYGIYCAYDDARNHAEMFIDPVYKVLATHAVVHGRDQGWRNTPLPSDFDPAAWHALDCRKHGESFTFSVDEGHDDQVEQRRTVSLVNGQPGLVVVDVRAAYRHFHASNEAADDAVSDP
ncbi:glycoside hydrolase family 43 protein [Oleiagrimonas soli]|nr:glycoside hydrolase family 43 protein [Oleiagrimonas soli]MBB6184512.1 GH43 family beta-xylosidase [Oleiagrimonas soli]